MLSGRDGWSGWLVRDRGWSGWLVGVAMVGVVGRGGWSGWFFRNWLVGVVGTGWLVTGGMRIAPPQSRVVGRCLVGRTRVASGWWWVRTRGLGYQIRGPSDQDVGYSVSGLKKLDWFSRYHKKYTIFSPSLPSRRSACWLKLVVKYLNSCMADILKSLEKMI